MAEQPVWDTRCSCGNIASKKKVKDCKHVCKKCYRYKPKKKKVKQEKKIISLKEIATEFADARRSKSTKAEKHFRKLLTTAKVVFKSEKTIMNNKSFYLVDFYIPSKGLCVEIDGGYHNDPAQKAKDIKRDADLASRGYHNWRMTNEECLDLTVTDVVEKINSYPDKKKIVRVIPYQEPRPYIPTQKHSQKKGNPRSNRTRKSKPIKTKHPSLDAIRALKDRREGKTPRLT